jgi:solute carrier family 25 (mitochondrial phosphate transporter), member 3
MQVLDPNYCVYYDNSEFQVYPSKSLAPYFSFLDGPRARYPVEKEKPLDLNIFLRFAACGAACGTAAHAVLIPIDVVKTRMQSEPKRYPSMGATFTTLLAEEGKDAFLLGAGATITGYFVYGGISFGLTEYFKRKFVEVSGPTVAALYPVPILLFAR